MEQVTFVIDNKKDANLLIAIAEKIGIKNHIVSKTSDACEKNNRKKLYKIIDAGVDVSNFSDPSIWQKQTRKDRILTKRT